MPSSAARFYCRVARKYRSRAVSRAFRVLELLGEHPGGLTLAAMARQTGVAMSSLLPILGSLAECSTVRILPERRYALDVGVLQLAHRYIQGADLVCEFAPIGQRLVQEFNETVQMGVLSGSEVTYIAREESRHPVRLVSQLGHTVPAQNSAIGKALLSGLRADRLRELIGPEPFPALTSSSLRTYRSLERDLHSIRVNGFGESREECIEGLHCVSAAIKDPSGALVAALSISTPVFRMNPSTRLAMIRSVKSAADEISYSVARVKGQRLEQLDDAVEGPGGQQSGRLAVSG